MTKGAPSSTCELHEHPLGWELRASIGGDDRLTQVHRDRVAALAHAEELRRRLVKRGWTEGELG